MEHRYIKVERAQYVYIHAVYTLRVPGLACSDDQMQRDWDTLVRGKRRLSSLKFPSTQRKTSMSCVRGLQPSPSIQP